jgi:hypothetical protein
MHIGSAMLHVDWLDGRTLGDWQFGVKVLCERFSHMIQINNESALHRQYVDAVQAVMSFLFSEPHET